MMEIKLTATDPKFKLGDLVYNRMTGRNFVVTWINVEVRFHIGGTWENDTRITYTYCGKDVAAGYHVEDTWEEHLMLASENVHPIAKVTVNDDGKGGSDGH